jgi:hypothetical protein
MVRVRVRVNDIFYNDNLILTLTPHLTLLSSLTLIPNLLSAITLTLDNDTDNNNTNTNPNTNSNYTLTARHNYRNSTGKRLKYSVA